MRTIAAAAILVPLLVTTAHAAEPEISKLSEGDVLVSAGATAIRSDTIRLAQGGVLGELVVAPHVAVGVGLLAGWASYLNGPTTTRIFGASARVSFPFGLSSWVSVAPYAQLDVTKGDSLNVYDDGSRSSSDTSSQRATVGLALLGLVSEHVFLRLDLGVFDVSRVTYDGVTSTGFSGRLGNPNVNGLGFFGGGGIAVGVRL